MSDQIETTPGSKRGSLVFLLPLAAFAGLALLFFLQLTSGRNNSDIPSALIGKPAPEFSLAGLPGAVRDGVPIAGFTNETLSGGKVTLVNIWASWCIPCRAEHPFVEKLAEDPRLSVYGINYKDKDDTALAFLDELGNPYDAIGVDDDGRVGIEFGVYGVPETFVVNGAGIIVHKFIGPITQSRLDNELMPAIDKALTE